MGLLGLKAHLDPGVQKDPQEKWVYLGNRVQRVETELAGPKETPVTVLKTLCNGMPAPEVSYLRLPRALGFLDPQDPRVYPEKMGQREKEEILPYMTRIIMHTWSGVPLDPKVHQAPLVLLANAVDVANGAGQARPP